MVRRPLVDGRLRLTPLRPRDASEWARVRRDDAEHLQRWESADPREPARTWEELHRLPRVWARLRASVEAERRGTGLDWAVRLDDRLVGQVGVADVLRGAAQQATLGYWVASSARGRGVAPAALALAADHAWQVLRLHRLVVEVRPENVASLRVVAKLGFRAEGLRPAHLWVDGAWRDHEAFALLAEEVPDGLHARWVGTRAGPVG